MITRHLPGVGMIRLPQSSQRRAIVAEVNVVICQIDRLTDQRQRSQPLVQALRMRAFRTGASDRRVGTRSDMIIFSVVDIFDPRRPNIARAIARRQLRPVRAAFDIAALPFDQLLQTQTPPQPEPDRQPDRATFCAFIAAAARQVPRPIDRRSLPFFADVGVSRRCAAARPRQSAICRTAILRSRRHGCAAECA